MESKLIDMASSNGFFAVLFLVLLFYVLRENAIREKGYQAIIKSLQTEIKAGISEIGAKIEKILK